MIFLDGVDGETKEKLKVWVDVLKIDLLALDLLYSQMATKATTTAMPAIVLAIQIAFFFFPKRVT